MHQNIEQRVLHLIFLHKNASYPFELSMSIKMGRILNLHIPVEVCHFVSYLLTIFNVILINS
jgi:hypothetical protein